MLLTYNFALRMYLSTKPVTSVVRRNLSLKSVIKSSFPFKPNINELSNSTPSVNDICYSCSSLSSCVESVLLSKQTVSSVQHKETFVSSEKTSIENKYTISSNPCRIRAQNYNTPNEYLESTVNYLSCDFTKKVGLISFYTYVPH